MAREIASKFNPKTIAKDGYIVRTGSICNESLFIEKGIIRSFTDDLDGNEVTTAFYTRNSFSTDLPSFFKRTPAKEHQQAITDCEVVFITYEEMQASFHSIPQFREYGRLNLVNQYSILKERMLSALQKTAEQRYSDLINSDAELLQTVPLKYIASFLGITDTSLSRIRRELMKK